VVPLSLRAAEANFYLARLPGSRELVIPRTAWRQSFLSCQDVLKRFCDSFLGLDFAMRHVGTGRWPNLY
jgi:hypothetical protein